MKGIFPPPDPGRCPRGRCRPGQPLAPPHRITEAQAFLHAAMTSGGALGTAVGGVMIDHLGPGGGLLGAIVLIALGSVLCATQLGRWRRLTL